MSMTFNDDVSERRERGQVERRRHRTRVFRTVASAYTMRCEWGKNFLLLLKS
jgi:hypothetical protein